MQEAYHASNLHLTATAKWKPWFRPIILSKFKFVAVFGMLAVICFGVNPFMTFQLDSTKP
jgi:hypothetical protein